DRSNVAGPDSLRVYPVYRSRGSRGWGNYQPDTLVADAPAWDAGRVCGLPRIGIGGASTKRAADGSGSVDEVCRDRHHCADPCDCGSANTAHEYSWGASHCRVWVSFRDGFVAADGRDRLLVESGLRNDSSDVAAHLFDFSDRWLDPGNLLRHGAVGRGNCV